MNRIISWLEYLFVGISVLCMISIMTLVTTDALGRYLFKAPLQWSYELVTFYLMVIAIYFAAASTLQNGDHIGVDLLYHVMGKRIRAWVEIVTTIVAGLVFAAVTYAVWVAMIKHHALRDFIPGYISWPTWLSYLPIVLGVGLMVLRMAHHTWMLLRHGEDPHVVDHLADVNKESLL